MHSKTSTNHKPPQTKRATATSESITAEPTKAEPTIFILLAPNLGARFCYW